MREPTGVMLDNEGNVVPHTKCPRCGAPNRMVPHGEPTPDRRRVAGVEYELYQCVCHQCSLYFNEALVVVSK